MKSAVIAAVVAAVVAAASGTAATIVVTSKNIKNGTIQTVDISAKAKRALKGNCGPRGPAGLPGMRGAQGPQGSHGPPGPRGPSTALTGERNVIVGEVPDTEANIGHISLPPGSYVVFAKAAFVNPGAETLVECLLSQSGKPENFYDRGNLKLLASGPGFDDAGVVSLVAHTYSDVQISGLDFRCKDHGGSVQFFDQLVRAIQVEHVQSSP
jgi:hypothetical protein